MDNYDELIDRESLEFALGQSWEVHRQAFGPILEPAFTENKQVRILLINALNHISRRNIERGMELLKQIHPHCSCNEDKAAWAFFVGLCFEMSGAKEQMLKWYETSETFGHRFYLPYMKLAKAAHAAADFEKAKRYYVLSIECLNEMENDDKEEAVIGSAYTNLVSCYTMLHMYRDAEKAWQKAQEYPLQPGADATAAIMYAAMKDEKKTAEHIEKLKKTFPAWVEQTKNMTDLILNGTHPSFPAE